MSSGVENPTAVLFCCDYNSVRSPMAEALTKHFFGFKFFIQSAGVRHDRDVDGFAVAVCSEMGVELSKHRVRSFAEMEEWGDDISAFDLIVALTPASQRAALEYTRFFSLDVEYWPTMDPSAIGRTRDEKLEAYRQCRDQLIERIKARFV